MMSRLAVCFALVLTLVLSPSSSAQFRQAPPPEVVSLVTKDGVQLKLTYFPGPERKGSAEAKQVTPVVLLHDYKETRAIFSGLAQRFQTFATEEKGSASFAVVTVDLRAHGDSTKAVFPNGEAIDLDASKLRKEDYFAMVTMDMAAVRSFLLSKNDAGELNLNKLCVVGSGMGASIAANWALQDWSWPPLAIGKQGQDVKALVLLSPRWSYTGLTMQAPLRFRPLKQNVAWMLVYGAEDPKVAADVRRIEKQLQRFHPEPDAAGAQGSSSLQVVPMKSKLQGSTLLRQVGAPIEEKIIGFLSEHVATKNYPWINRLGRLP
ncbi:MAG: alpha/beta fold hydrolase [Pirellulales bacterium]